MHEPEISKRKAYLKKIYTAMTTMQTRHTSDELKEMAMKAEYECCQKSISEADYVIYITNLINQIEGKNESREMYKNSGYDTNNYGSTYLDNSALNAHEIGSYKKTYDNLNGGYGSYNNQIFYSNTKPKMTNQKETNSLYSNSSIGGYYGEGLNMNNKVETNNYNGFKPTINRTNLNSKQTRTNLNFINTGISNTQQNINSRYININDKMTNNHPVLNNSNPAINNLKDTRGFGSSDRKTAADFNLYIPNNVINANFNKNNAINGHNSRKVTNSDTTKTYNGNLYNWKAENSVSGVREDINIKSKVNSINGGYVGYNNINVNKKEIFNTKSGVNGLDSIIGNKNVVGGNIDKSVLPSVDNNISVSSINYVANNGSYMGKMNTKKYSINTTNNFNINVNDNNYIANNGTTNKKNNGFNFLNNGMNTMSNNIGTERNRNINSSNSSKETDRNRSFYNNTAETENKTMGFVELNNDSNSNAQNVISINSNSSFNINDKKISINSRDDYTGSNSIKQLFGDKKYNIKEKIEDEKQIDDVGLNTVTKNPCLGANGIDIFNTEIYKQNASIKQDENQKIKEWAETSKENDLINDDFKSFKSINIEDDEKIELLKCINDISLELNSFSQIIIECKDLKGDECLIHKFEIAIKVISAQIEASKVDQFFMNLILFKIAVEKCKKYFNLVLKETENLKKLIKFDFNRCCDKIKKAFRKKKEEDLNYYFYVSDV